MMKKVWFICSLVVFLSLNAYAEYIIKGSVYDAESNQAISSARASLLNAKDSTFVKGQNTDEKGIFEIKDIDKGVTRVLDAISKTTPLCTHCVNAL